MANTVGWRSASITAQLPPSDNPATAHDGPGGRVPRSLLTTRGTSRVR
nr:hypothetical protein [Pseudonocardia sp. AL041005-10]